MDEYKSQKLINPHGSSGPEDIAILLCDTPIQDVVEQHGTYFEIFSSLFEKSISSCKDIPPIRITTYDVVNKPPPSAKELSKKFKGVVLTGSFASAYEDKEWILNLVNWLQNVNTEAPNLKLLGICFGHQILARAFGGQVVKNVAGWELGVHELNLNEEGESLFSGEPDSMIKVLRIHEVHQDHVVRLPKGFINIASTEKSENQIMIHRNEGGKINIMGIQGHPEFVPGIVTKIINNRESSKVLTPEFAQESRDKARLNEDGVYLGRLCLKMLIN